MKHIKVILFALCSVLFVACNGSKPGSTVEAFLHDIQNEKYQEASQLVYVENAAEAEEVEALCEKMGSYTKEAGGIKSYEVVSEDIAENGETATVKVKIIFNAIPEGTEPEINTYCLRKVDKQWKIDLTQK